MKNNARKFLDAISENTELRKYLETYQIPDGMEKEDCLVAVAEKFGFAVTKEELMEAFRCKQEELKTAVAGAEAAVQEIPLGELDSVAGGGDVGAANQNLKGKGEHPECKVTYKNWENCTALDGCDLVLIKYSNYLCKESWEF